MCFKTRMVEKCGEYMKAEHMQVRDDLIPSIVDGYQGSTISSEAVIHSTLETAQLMSNIRELSGVLRRMVEKHNTIPPCDDTCDSV